MFCFFFCLIKLFRRYVAHEIMGNSKNQMAWNRENSKIEVERMGIKYEVWQELVARYFGSVSMDKMDSAMHQFHAELRAIKENK